MKLALIIACGIVMGEFGNRILTYLFARLAYWKQCRDMKKLGCEQNHGEGCMTAVAAPPVQQEPSAHQPLMYRDDGTEILGLKRCSACGLSETYWKRFPECP
jgi:hypothetical protein